MITKVILKHVLPNYVYVFRLVKAIISLQLLKINKRNINTVCTVFGVMWSRVSKEGKTLDSHMTIDGQALVFHCGGQGSFSDQSLWNSWWKN